MKRLVRVILIFCVLFCLAVFGSAEDSTITDMDVNCTIDKYGNCDTTVTVNINFTSSTNDVRLPVGSNVSRVSVSGGTFTKKVSDGVTWLELKNANGTQGTRNFVITFRQKKVVSPNDEGTQTLNLELLCPYWVWRIDNLHFTITFPKEYDSVPTFSSGYYKEDISVDTEQTELTLSGTVLTPVIDEEELVVTMELPSGYCRILHRQGMLAWLTKPLLVITLIASVLYWLIELANPLPENIDRKLLPDGIGAWEYPLVLSNAKPDLPLLIFEWADLGYLSMQISGRGRVTLRKEMEMSSERKPYEKEIFDSLFARNDQCPGDTAGFRRIAEIGANKSTSYWVSRLFREKSGNPKLLHIFNALICGIACMQCADYLFPTYALRFFLLLIMLAVGIAGGAALQYCFQRTVQKDFRYLLPALVLTALGIWFAQNKGGALLPVLAVLIQLFGIIGTFRGGKRTQSGLKMISQIYAFRRELKSLNSAKLQLNLNRDSHYYYRILPYAEALGYGKKFSAAFENIKLDSCPWFTREDAVYSTASDFYLYFRDALRRMRREKGVSRRRLRRLRRR